MLVSFIVRCFSCLIFQEEITQDPHFLLVLAESTVVRTIQSNTFKSFGEKHKPKKGNPKKDFPQWKISGANYRDGCMVVKGKFLMGSD